MENNKLMEVKKKILNILGANFKYNWIFDENKDKNKILCFEFINKSNIQNIMKSKYINDKIDNLISEGFIEVENLKISNKGRFIIIELKTIDDYENEKKNIEQEYLNMINQINNKITIISKQKYLY